MMVSVLLNVFASRCVSTRVCVVHAEVKAERSWVQLEQW